MKIKECTPRRLRCGIGACPSVFKLSDGKLIIIGHPLSPEESEQLGLSKKIGKKEAAISIHSDYFEEFKP